MFAALGAHVVLIARNSADLERICTDIRKSGGSAEFWAIDLTSLEEFKRNIESLLALDIFVNNIGINS